MNCTRTVQERIKDLRKDKGVILEEVAEATGLSKSAIGYYEDTEGDRDIAHTSIISLANYYDVSADYLLGLTENPKPVSIPVSDLHLDDEVIACLKSGKFNNRLWCEITKHPSFLLLLADMEIYVDGIASMQINTLNAFVDNARKTITEKYHLPDDDYYMHTLDTAHIDEFQYFSIQIHNDLDEILKDLRESHAKDSTSAPAESPLDIVKAGLEEAAAEADYDEKVLAIWYKTLEINKNALDPEERKVFVKALKKSKKVQRMMKQQKRKKRR